MPNRSFGPPLGTAEIVPVHAPAAHAPEAVKAATHSATTPATIPARLRDIAAMLRPRLGLCGGWAPVESRRNGL